MEIILKIDYYLMSKMFKIDLIVWKLDNKIAGLVPSKGLK